MAFAPAVWFAVQDHLSDDKRESSKNVFNDFEDKALFENFHLTRPCINFIMDCIRLAVKKHTYKLKPEVLNGLVMVALEYYANGISSLAIQEKAGINHQKTPEVIGMVSKILTDMLNQFITFPITRDDRYNVAHKIEMFCGIPKVLGVLACAHFKVKTSSQDSHSSPFHNTLGYTSVTAQVICDCKGNLMSVEGCHVGSTPAQTIWESSVKGKEMEREHHGSYWLIGEKNYKLSQHVLTAVSVPGGTDDLRFNEAHAKLHSVMQQTLNSLKCRFKCLMQMTIAQQDCLDKQADIIMACCVLHNIAKKFSVPSLPLPNIFEPVHPEAQYQGTTTNAFEVVEARDKLIRKYFSNANSFVKDEAVN
ncbi:putative nuclease HARBI1 [Aplochiton taeniatus]